MRRSSSVTSVSWIPSEAIPGPMKMPFAPGVGHYDAPLPSVLGDLTGGQDLFRFANHLAARIEVDDTGHITGHGYGGGPIGSTTLRIGPASTTFAAFSYQDLQAEPAVGDDFVIPADGRRADRRADAADR